LYVAAFLPVSPGIDSNIVFLPLRSPNSTGPHFGQ
jgi:hypothetical protein